MVPATWITFRSSCGVSQTAEKLLHPVKPQNHPKSVKFVYSVYDHLFYFLFYDGQAVAYLGQHFFVFYLLCLLFLHDLLRRLADKAFVGKLAFDPLHFTFQLLLFLLQAIQLGFVTMMSSSGMKISAPGTTADITSSGTSALLAMKLISVMLASFLM